MLPVCNERAGWRGTAEVKPGTSYLFTAWAKTKGGRGTTCLRVRGAYKVNDERKTMEASGKGVLATGDKWVLLSLEFTTPAEVKNVQLWMWNVNGGGDEVWFDDAELVEKPKP